MSLPNSLYEPKLAERWASRYRDFEIDEMVRRLRKVRNERVRRRAKPSQPERPDEPKEAA